jgi:hypothetical protein
MGGSVVMLRLWGLRSGRVGLLFAEVPCNRLLVKFVGFPLNDGDGILRTLAETGPEPVTEVVCGENRLAVDDFYGPFRAGRDAEPAAVTSFLVDLNNFSLHFNAPLI